MKYKQKKTSSLYRVQIARLWTAHCQYPCIVGLIGLISLGASSVALAGIPVWKFTPLTPTTISVSNIEITSVQYLVTNQSTKSHTLVLNNNTQGISQNTTAGYCANPFTLGSQKSCILNLTIVGANLQANVVGGPVVCEQGNALQCYQPSTANSLNITAFAPLTVSVSNLALSVNDTGLNAQLTGTPRTITVTNTDTAKTAENLTITYPTWPTGTSTSTTCTSTLGAGGKCTITVTPGANATSDCNAGEGTAPTPGVITISSTNVPASVTTDVEILSYGCIYQEGYIFSIDDTTSANTSIGGTIVSLADNSAGAAWYNSSFETTGAQSLIDGAANTATIISVQGSGSGNYAAEICANYSIDSSGNSPCVSGTCYDNWYLPAICQLGGYNPSQGMNAYCPSGTPSMSSNLPGLIGCVDSDACIFGYHWSSTESSGTDPAFPSSGYAWYEYFYSAGTTPPDFQDYDIKSSSTNAIRCTRALTS